MKKKPELLKKTGKSSLTLRNFLNNLKENDLHYENKQITQCVFLGVLRLKPVPSIFSNNVPSTSTAVESNKPKRIKNNNSNKELNKNVSKKTHINKVLSGKITKKNTQKVKAAVKKVPSKKPNIKIKLSTNKKINKDNVEPSTSNSEQEITSDMSKTASSDSIIVSSTITLKPIMSPTKFNPVQNLFNKLKQRIDESQNEPGPSQITNPMTRENLKKSATVKYSVCKINANRQSNLNTDSSKKLKRHNIQKKSLERLPFPLISTSPITISDTESIGKKDKDDVIFLEGNSITNNSSSEKGVLEQDVIIINDDPKPKNKERISPRNRTTLSSQVITHRVVPNKKRLSLMPSKQKSKHGNSNIPVVVNTNTEQQIGNSQSQDVIIISDEPKQNENLYDDNLRQCENRQELSSVNKDDIIVIDEIKEVRVSPRLRKIEGRNKKCKGSVEKTVVDEVIVVTDEAKILNTNTISENHLQNDSVDISKIQQLNITIENQQQESTKQNTSPNLLKIFETNEKTPATIKKEYAESEVTIVNEKPKRRKNSIMSSTLLPPMLLNAPMLLRSELAQKKSNYTAIEKPKLRKTRDKIKDISYCKSIKTDMDQTKNINKNTLRKLINTDSKVQPLLEKEHSKPQTKYSPENSQVTRSSTDEFDMQPNNSVSNEVICLSDTFKQKDTYEKTSVKQLDSTLHNTATNRDRNNHKINMESEKVQQQQPTSASQEEIQTGSLENLKLQDSTSLKDQVINNNQDAILIEPNKDPSANENVTLHKTNIIDETSLKLNLHKDDNIIVIKDENKPKEKVSPRLLRSDLSKQKMLENLEVNKSTLNEGKIPLEIENLQLSVTENFISEVNETINLTEELESNKHISPRTLRSNIIQQKSPTSQKPLEEETILIKEDEVPAQKLPLKIQQPDTVQPKTKPKSIHKSKLDLDEIIIVNERRGKKDRSSGRLLRSEMAHLKSKEKSANAEVEEVVVLIHDEPKHKKRSLISSLKLNTVETSSNSGAEDVIVVPEEEIPNQIDEISPRSLRSDTNRKLSPKLTPTKTKRFRILKEEDITLPVAHIDVVDLQVIPQNNSEVELEEIPSSRIIKVEQEGLSRRLLRSEITPKEVSQNRHNDKNTDNSITSSSRVLRSEMAAQKSPQNLSPRTVKDKRSPQKSPQSINCEADMISSNRIVSDSRNIINYTKLGEEVIIPESPTSKKSPKTILNKQLEMLAVSKKLVALKRKVRVLNRKAKSLITSNIKLKTPMLLRSELAQLKNVGTDVEPNVIQTTKRKSKSKLKKLNIRTNQQLENANLSLESTKATSLENHLQKVSKRNTNPIQIKDKNDCEILESSEEHLSKEQNINDGSDKESNVTILPSEVPVIPKESTNVKNKPLKKHKRRSKKNIADSSVAKIDLVATQHVSANESANETVRTDIPLILEESKKKNRVRKNRSYNKLKKSSMESDINCESSNKTAVVDIIEPIILKESNTVKSTTTKKNRYPNTLKKISTEPVNKEFINKTNTAETPQIIQKSKSGKSTPRDKSLRTMTETATEPSNKKSIYDAAKIPIIVEKTERDKNTPRKKDRSSNRLKKNSTGSSRVEVDVNTAGSASPKRNLSHSRKTAGKMKPKEVKSSDIQKTPEKTEDNFSTQIQITSEKSEVCNVTPKKPDITVFDFDESEPEVLPLRLNSTPKKDRSIPLISNESSKSTPLKANVPQKTKKQKVADEPATKVQAKAKLLPMFDEESSQKKHKQYQDPPNQDIPLKSENGNSTITKLISKKSVKNQATSEEQISHDVEKTKKDISRPCANQNNTSPSKQNRDPPINTTKTRTSPLKQATITDMFSNMLKREKSSTDSVFEPAPKELQSEPPKETSSDVSKTDMPAPPKPDAKPRLPSNNQEEEDELYDDDDSDCESRMEWIPEEYAEYKFKYSAKKMMTYKPIHKCKICLLILPTYYKLSKHKEEHAKKENPYNCKHCDQAFSNIEDLTAHLRIHKGKHPYTCKKCDIGFWSKKALDAHTPIHVLRKVKQPNKRFRCDVCAKEFSKLCDMERHTRVHTGEKPCVCNICNKRFQQSHNLSKHLLTHLHVKPFHCEICNKQFGRNDVLNRHLLTHSVEKPIKCPLCPKGFIRQTQLNNHMKKNHPEAARIDTAAQSNVAEAN